MSYSLALHPQAPALTRPQRMVLRVEGERIVDVEYRPDVAPRSAWAHVGRLPVEQLVATAAELCPSCGVAHALALCQALEQLSGIVVPARAAALRVLAAELERAASHLATLSAICAAVGLDRPSTAYATQSASLREALWALAGRPPGAWLIPGGVASDPGLATLDAPAALASQTLRELLHRSNNLVSRRGLLARTVEVGIISPNAAAQFRLSGPLARASGLAADVRQTAPYAAYDRFPPQPIVQNDGDVHNRLLVLTLEAIESIRMVEQLANNPPAGAVSVPLPAELPSGIAEAVVEAPRGPLRYGVEAVAGKLVALTCQPAPQLDRLLARTVLAQSQLDDALLIVLSTDPCDACLGAASAEV